MAKKAGQTPAKKASITPSAKPQPAASEPEVKLEVQIQDTKGLPPANPDAAPAFPASVAEAPAVGDEGAQDASEGEDTEEESKGDEGEEDEEAEDEEEDEIAGGIDGARGEGAEGDGRNEERSEKEEGTSREFEVFIGGLPADVEEEDIRKVLQQVGEVVEVRLMRKYAFVRFTTQASAQRACTELKTVQIKEKSCEIVPREDDTVLFLGNIETSWSKSKVDQTLKSYKIKGIRKLTLKEDQARKGMNRGFAIIEFRTHQDARAALKRLAKKDAVFGKNKSAKVKWLYSNEPDEAAISQVKAVVADGILPSWTEENVKAHFSKFGEVECVTLNQKKKKAKQINYAVIDFSTREAAVACVDALKDTEIVEGEEKIKLKVRLPKPYAKPRRKVIVYGGFPVPKAQGQGVLKKSQKGFTQGRNNSLGQGTRPYKRPSAWTRAARPREPVEGTLPRPLMVPASRSSRYSIPEETRLQQMHSPDFRRRYDVVQSNYAPLPARVIPHNVSVPLHGDSYSLRAGQDLDYGRDVPAEHQRARDFVEPLHSLKRQYSSLDADPGFYTSTARGLPRARIDPLTTSHLHSSRVLGDPYSNAIGEGRVVTSQSSLGLHNQSGSLVGGGDRGSLYGVTDYISSDTKLRDSALLGGWPGSSRYSYSGSGTGPYY